MSEERLFPNDAASVAEARRYVLASLGELAPEVAEAIALMVSELTGNAVRHTYSPFTVVLERTATRIRVEVNDGGSGDPIVRAPEPSEPSGRGLRIVEALASSWGVLPSPGGPGKTVWFVVDLASEADERTSRASHRGV